jgi:hypothetical protein
MIGVQSTGATTNSCIRLAFFRRNLSLKLIFLFLGTATCTRNADSGRDEVTGNLSGLNTPTQSTDIVQSLPLPQPRCASEAETAGLSQCSGYHVTSSGTWQLLTQANAGRACGASFSPNLVT